MSPDRVDSAATDTTRIVCVIFLITRPLIEVLDALDDGQGLYRKEALHAEDYELWTRARFVTRIANLPDALLTRRKHDGTIGNQIDVRVAALEGEQAVARAG